MLEKSFYPFIAELEDDRLTLTTPIGKKPTTLDAAHDQGREHSNGHSYFVVTLDEQRRPAEILDADDDPVTWDDEVTAQVLYQLGYTTTSLTSPRARRAAGKGTPNVSPWMLVFSGLIREVVTIPKRPAAILVALTVALSCWALLGLGAFTKTTPPADAPVVTVTTTKTVSPPTPANTGATFEVAPQ